MSISKLIQDQSDLFASMDKRFADTLGARDFQQRIGGITEDREKRILQRIKALETQKAADIARYDRAIETEKKALEELKSHRIDTNPKPAPKPSTPGGRPRAAVSPETGKVKSGGADTGKQATAKPVPESKGSAATPAQKAPPKPKPA